MNGRLKEQRTEEGGRNMQRTKPILFGEHPDDELLNRYFDGETGTEETAAVLDHLRRCEKCRDRLAGLQTVRDLLLLGEDNSPKAAASAVGKAVHAEKRRRLVVRLTSAAAVAVLAFGIGFGILRSHNPAIFAPNEAKSQDAQFEADDTSVKDGQYHVLPIDREEIGGMDQVEPSPPSEPNTASSYHPSGQVSGEDDQVKTVTETTVETEEPAANDEPQ